MSSEACVIENYSEPFAVGDKVEASKHLAPLFERFSAIISKQSYIIIESLSHIQIFAGNRDVTLGRSIANQQLIQLYSDKYMLLEPIVFNEIDIINGMFYIFNNDFKVSGSGRTMREAKEEAAESIIDLYEYYNQSKRSKSKEVLVFIDKLNRIIRKK